MPKASKIAKNSKRAILGDRYAERRALLSAVIRDPAASLDEKAAAYSKIYKMPRDGARSRHRNRCQLTGRPRAYMREFGVSSITFRELAVKGMLPGVKKSSW